MAHLKEDHKLFVVQHLATFHTPAQIAKLLRQQFDVEASPQQISAYNPDTLAGARMSDELKQVFRDTRDRFLSDSSDIAITHKNWRLRKLQSLLDHPALGNSKLALEVLRFYEQAEGGMFLRQQQEEGDAAGLKELRAFLGVSEGEPGDGQSPGA